MDIFEINKDGISEKEINVEEIMGKIRQNIRKRKESTIFSGRNGEVIQRGLSELHIDDSDIQRDFEYINSNWDPGNNSYFISSHRLAVGKFLIKGRELVNGEIKRYVDPIIGKQTAFNGSTVRLLNDTAAKFNHYNSEIEHLRSEIDSKIENLRPEFEGQIEQLRPEFENEIESLKSEIKNSIRSEINSIITSMKFDIENKVWLASILESKVKEGSKKSELGTPDTGNLDINYFRFEEQFRGSREDIKQRQSNFITYFTDCSNVLDIGCGRGEFLELLKELGIGAKGIDIDDTMVDYCLSKGLTVVKDEAISYLEKLDDRSLDGIFIDQVVEHLEPNYLINLLQLCFQKLKYGYYIFVETVNPLSLISFANFYIDMTHKKPIHPETLKFLLSSAGFRDLDTKFFSPVSEEARLKKAPLNDGMEEWAKKYLDTYNHNIEKLNDILYGAQDYAVIGKK
jgi:2-polyprenyl-3-methyl-5-hydroxy-6-metoxy-1,4-benzoquinol methylase